NTTTGTVEPGKTDTLPDGTKATHEDVDGPDGTMTWKHCDGNDGDHDPHTEITTSKASGHLEGDGYTLTMKSKSKITAKGNDTDVHHKSGSTGSTFSGEGNNNHGHLHGGNNPITWSGKNNTNTNS
ncbi:hypothetical protein HN532_00265, partial [archaeon]|nr:hypothetical protein [archaeon]